MQVFVIACNFEVRMKYRLNLPALFLATLFMVASNGIAVFEHICNISNTHHYSLFSNTTCEMDKPVASCCAKNVSPSTKKDCCAHKQFFSKLSIEGFTAKQLILKPSEKQTTIPFGTIHAYAINFRLTERYYSGLAPPDNYYTIQTCLQPARSQLQVFRC